MPKYMNPIGAAGTAVPVTPDFGGPGARMALARKFVYAMLGISVILLLLGVGGFYLLNGQIQSVEKEEADKRAQVGSAQQITSRYDGTLAEYNATNDQLRFLEKPQPENMYVPTMLPQLQALAETYGCQIKSITPGAIAANTPAAASSSSSSGGTPTGPAISYQIMPLAVDITGTYSNLMHFVYDLTEFPKIVTVKSLSLHPGGGNAPPGQKGAEIVDASLGLQTYVFNEDNSATTVPTSMPIGSAPEAATTPIVIKPITTTSAPKVSAATTPATRIVGTRIIKPTMSTAAPTTGAHAAPIRPQSIAKTAGQKTMPMTPKLPTNTNLGK